MSDPVEQRKYEQQFLRDEIASNKRLVFERAIAIVAIGLGASLIPADTVLPQFLGVLTVGALAFNLWFTSNRLNSNARIVAYYQIFHEPQGQFEWIGWESALQLHRIWSKQHAAEVKISCSGGRGKQDYDNLSFYAAIYGLHVSMAAFVCLIVAFSTWTSGPYETPVGDLPSVVFPIIYAFTLVVFGIWVVTLRPRDLKRSIEFNRWVWESVFVAVKNGRLVAPTYRPIGAEDDAPA